MAIERKCSFEAELSGGNGDISVRFEGEVQTTYQYLNSDLVRKCDDDGKFVLDDNRFGEVREVIYFSDVRDFWGREHKLSFTEYVTIGRPDSLLVHKAITYIPKTD